MSLSLRGGGAAPEQVMEDTMRKSKKAYKEVGKLLKRPAWVGGAPLPKGTLDRMRGKKEAADRKVQERKAKRNKPEEEIKFNQAEYTSFVTGFRKQKLKRKEFGVQRDKTERQSKARVERDRFLRENKEKKAAEEAERERKMEEQYARIDANDPMIRPLKPQKEDKARVKQEFKHGEGFKTSVVVERLEFDPKEARSAFLISLPELPGPEDAEHLASLKQNRREASRIDKEAKGKKRRKKKGRR